MKIHPKSSELTGEEKFIRAIKNAINSGNYDELGDIRLKEEYMDEFAKLLINYNKLNENRSKKRSR